MWHVLLVSALFLVFVYGVFSYALERGYPTALARTMAVNTIVVLEIFHLFFIRNLYGTSLTWAALRGTPAVWLTVLGVTGAQFTITYAPMLQPLFGTAAVPVGRTCTCVILAIWRTTASIWSCNSPIGWPVDAWFTSWALSE